MFMIRTDPKPTYYSHKGAYFASIILTQKMCLCQHNLPTPSMHAVQHAHQSTAWNALIFAV